MEVWQEPNTIFVTHPQYRILMKAVEMMSFILLYYYNDFLINSCDSGFFATAFKYVNNYTDTLTVVRRKNKGTIPKYGSGHLIKIIYI